MTSNSRTLLPIPGELTACSCSAIMNHVFSPSFVIQVTIFTVFTKSFQNVCAIHSENAGIPSTLYIGVAMVFVFSPILSVSSQFDF